MSIIEDPHPTRLQLDDGRHFARERRLGLPGATIAEIDIYRTIVQRAGSIDQRTDLPGILEVGNRALIYRACIWNAYADVVESQLAQQPHRRPIGLGQIDLDAVVAHIVIQQVEALAQMAHQPAKLPGIGRAPRQVKLLDSLLRPQVTANQVDLTLQPHQVGGDIAVLRKVFSPAAAHETGRW
ncbi:hypothetical protein D9M68_673110 [compost metagenome]